MLRPSSACYGDALTHYRLVVNTRIEWVDAAKGIGIFLVVLGHAIPPVGVVPAIIWTFHMPLFFFLSGFTSRASTWHSLGMTARGLRSIVIPYIFFSVISIAIWATSTHQLFSLAEWRSQLGQMTFGVSGPEHLMPYNVPLWFFTCLLSVKLLFAMLTMILRSKPQLISAAALVALAAHVFVFPLQIPMVWNLDVAFSALAFFMAGYVFKDFATWPWLASSWAKPAVMVIPALIIWTAVVINGRIDMNGRGFGNPAMYYAGAFAGIMLTAAISQLLDGLGWVATVGRASILIFPVHALFWLLPNAVISVPRWYAFKITHSELMSYVVITLIEIAVCMPLYFLILRRAPFLLGQFVKPRSANNAAVISG